MKDGYTSSKTDIETFLEKKYKPNHLPQVVEPL
jgi:hypothetical protein